MKIEDLEKKILENFVRKYKRDEIKGSKDLFVLQLRGVYKKKELRYSDLVDSGSPVVVITAENYEECFTTLLKKLEDA